MLRKIKTESLDRILHQQVKNSNYVNFQHHLNGLEIQREKLMKKKIYLIFLIILCCLCITGCEKSQDKNSIVMEDINAFRNYFENGYVFYDEINRKATINFDSKKILREYNKNFTWRKKKGLEKNCINGINQDALLVPLWNFLYDLDIKDGHLGIRTFERNWKLSKQESVYSSEYFFEKKNGNYYLLESPQKNLIGKKYTGNISDLKKIIKNNQELYFFGPSLTDGKEYEILTLERKNYKVPISLIDSAFNDKAILRLVETDDSLYIRAGSFNIIKGSDEEQLFMREINKIPALEQGKKYIVLDLRGNSGGYTYYPKELVAAIYNRRKSEKQREDLWRFLNKADMGCVELQSSIIAQKKYETNIKNHQSDEIIESSRLEAENQKNNNKRYYIGLENIAPNKLPQDTGQRIDATLVILIDYYTASNAEHCIGYLYMMNKNNIILVGQNSSGTLISGNPIQYELPNSKLIVSFASTSYKNTVLLQCIEQWKGETYGFYPDYWCTETNVSETVGFITHDKKLIEQIDF